MVEQEAVNSKNIEIRKEITAWISRLPRTLSKLIEIHAMVILRSKTFNVQ